MELSVSNIAVAALILAVGVILSLIAGSLLKGVVRRLSHRTGTLLDDVILSAAVFPTQAAIVVFATEMAVDRLTFISEKWAEQIDRVFFVLYAVILFIFLYKLLGGLVLWYGREVAHRTETDLDDKFLDLFRRLALIVLTALIIIMVLGRFGIEVSGLVATLGITSLAVALAAQDTLGNMFAGLSIMVDQPFAVGDRVEILDINTWGDVQEIGLRSTRILTRDNRTVIIPNSIIGQGLVVNYTVPSEKYRVETHVGVAYGTEIEYAREVLISAIRQQDWVMQEELIEALFLEFGGSELTFRVRCWIENYVETRRIMDKMNTAIYNALRDADIAIPFPQRDVRVVSDLRLARSEGQAENDA